MWAHIKWVVNYVNHHLPILFAHKCLQEEIGVAEERLAAMTPNMAAITAYFQKVIAISFAQTALKNTHKSCFTTEFPIKVSKKMALFVWKWYLKDAWIRIFGGLIW